MLCKCAKVNIVIVRRLGSRLEYERHSVTSPNERTIITSIISNDRGAVRSHFERVVSVSEVRWHPDDVETFKTHTRNIDGGNATWNEEQKETEAHNEMEVETLTLNMESLMKT